MELPNKEEKSEKKEECIELKNIKYKTMLLSGNVPKETTVSDNMSNLDKFLENDKINNNSLNDLPWSKLDKTIKTVKILQYSEKYALENVLSSSEKQGLIVFLKDCLDKKKLQRVKDVEYSKEIGEIKSIPALQYMKQTKHFTLKNVDKRVSTLKSLPPKKGSIKNTKLNVEIDEDATNEVAEEI
jgi:hypothetical protein